MAWARPGPVFTCEDVAAVGSRGQLHEGVASRRRSGLATPAFCIRDASQDPDNAKVRKQL